MHCTMNIGMLRSLITHKPINHLLRHLAGGSTIEKDKRVTIDLEFKDREIGTDALDVKRRDWL
jgi:hypothetical protein